jgi:hypothetical protein
MFKIIIHMGLGKTATTSLQNNFFLKLHQRKKINFLGRAFTNTQRDYFNPFGIIMAELRKDPLDIDKEIELRRRFHTMLASDKVNVISEESLTVTSSQKHELVYENLKRITEGCQVQILIGLRNPVDFFYSAYIEMHRWTYHRVKGKNTISKFLDAVSLEPDSSEYDMFFFDRLLRKIKLRFPDIKVYLFEQFKVDKLFLLEILQEVFELDINEMSFINDIGSENTRIYSDKAKRGEAVTLNQKIVLFINRVFREDVREKIKKLAFINGIYCKILMITSKVRVTSKPEHTKLTEEQVKKLSEILELDIGYLVNNFYLNAEDLKKYRY